MDDKDVQDLPPIAAMVTSPIVHGALVLINGRLYEESDMPRVMNELRRVAGHEQFLVVQVPDDVAMNVAGPDDLVDALKRLAKEALNAGQETRTVGDVGEARAGGEVSVLRQKRDGEGSLGRR